MYQLISLRMSRLRNWLSQEGAKRHKCRRMIFPHEINFKKKVKKWKCLPTSKVFRKTAVCKVPLCSAQLPGKVCSAGSMQWVLQDARCRWHQVRSPFSQLTVLLHGIHAVGTAWVACKVLLDRFIHDNIISDVTMMSPTMRGLRYLASAALHS